MSGFDGLLGLGRQSLTTRLGAGGVAAARDAALSRSVDRTLSLEAGMFSRPSSGGGYGDLAAGALYLQAGGLLLGMVGGYYQALNQKLSLKAAAQDAEHEERMAGINARLAEEDANAILEAGKDEEARVGLEYGQAKAAELARQGGSGFAAGEGSGAEVSASIELAARIDRAAIRRNAVRAAGQSRMEAVDRRNRGSLAGQAARNLRGTAGSIQPGLSVLTAGLEGGGSLLGRAAAYRSGRY